MTEEPILKRIDLRGVTGDLRSHLPAPKIVDDQDATRVVKDVLADVRARGDQAVREYTQRFDRVAVEQTRVPDEVVRAALDQIPAELRTALEAAHANIADYHRSQIHPDGDYARHGVSIKEIRRPVERAGLYVPGGLAPLASSVLMTAAPARVAGVQSLAMCSPPGPSGYPAAPILAAAAIAGVDDVYRVGGAQAVAAMAYGTESIAAVDVIVGPGNRYVAIAKQLVVGEGVVGVPSAFAGPSEVAVIADATTPAEFAAIDLVVQAEHGPDGLSYLITWSDEAAEAITEAVRRISEASPRRAAVEATYRQGGFCVLVDGAEQALAVADAVAAEHLQIMCSDPASLGNRVRNAGAVFLGPWAPASVGDYAAGPNHVLPTARSARFGSALRVDDFCKYIHVVDIDQAGFANLAPTVEALATAEDLTAHADSVRIRMEARSTSPASVPADGA